MEKFQHNVRAKNFKIGWIEEVRETVSLPKLGGKLLKIPIPFSPYPQY